ncbi:MAG TPA: hypothetical protein PLS92_05905 [Flavobacteriales bacterium]|nr:hypothetical protein [Flavobacteriales bacterium]HRA15733.1 hypothetical protein [Flavobacteriales bacterium]
MSLTFRLLMNEPRESNFTTSLAGSWEKSLRLSSNCPFTGSTATNMHPAKTRPAARL